MPICIVATTAAAITAVTNSQPVASAAGEGGLGRVAHAFPIGGRRPRCAGELGVVPRALLAGAPEGDFGGRVSDRGWAGGTRYRVHDRWSRGLARARSMMSARVPLWAM